MKNIIKITITALILTAFTACGTPNYTIDISHMSEEQIQGYEQALADALSNYETAEDDLAKSEYAFEIAHKYMTLGQHGKSIPYYEEVLEFDAVHYPALSNLAYIYETAGEIKKALEYSTRLYNEYFKEHAEVNGDYVRLLLKDKQFDKAETAVDNLAQIELGKNNEGFVQSLYDEIQEAQQPSQ